MPFSKSLKLNTGASIPTVALGTWQAAPGEVAKAVEAALKAGYRHIDCAWAYGNESEVGEGIKASGVPRSEIFLVSKLWSTFHRNPAKGLQESLDKLGTDYLDLYLMHWPIPLNGENKSVSALRGLVWSTYLPSASRLAPLGSYSRERSPRLG
jgi:glycerol 2-dehydrogenase (NADP+)